MDADQETEQRLTKLETKLSALSKTQDEILSEVKKFNNMVSMGKGMLMVLAGMGAILAYLLNAAKELYMAGRPHA